jgi:hypothetical protein
MINSSWAQYANVELQMSELRDILKCKICRCRPIFIFLTTSDKTRPRCSILSLCEVAIRSRNAAGFQNEVFSVIFDLLKFGSVDDMSSSPCSTRTLFCWVSGFGSSDPQVGQDVWPLSGPFLKSTES